MEIRRYVEWTTLWELFGGIDRREAVSRDQWDSLRELVGTLRQGESKAAWTAIGELFQSMNSHKAATRKEWDDLYNLLNKLWLEERQNRATREELIAHAGARSKFLQ